MAATFGHKVTESHVSRPVASYFWFTDPVLGRHRQGRYTGGLTITITTHRAVV